MMNKTGIIVLAAGNSSRLGRPKQLLPYKGKPLITHIVAEAHNASLHPIVVVTGAFSPEVTHTLQDQPVTLAHNQRWEEGTASSIVTGLLTMHLLHPNPKAAIISVCDQPYISAEIFQGLVNKKASSKKNIIACAYSDTVGTPVLFERRYFKQLLKLSGHEGVEELLQQYEGDIATIAFPRGEVDINTEQDYQNLPGC